MLATRIAIYFLRKSNSYCHNLHNCIDMIQKMRCKIELMLINYQVSIYSTYKFTKFNIIIIINHYYLYNYFFFSLVKTTVKFAQTVNNLKKMLDEYNVFTKSFSIV